MYKENGIPVKKFFFELKYDTFVGKPKDEVRAQFEDTYTENGVVRWVKSNNVVPEDFLYDFRDLGLIPPEFIEKSLVTKDIDTKRHVDEWIESRKRWMKEDPEGFKEAQRENRFEAMYS